MIYQLENLAPSEADLLLRAPLLVCILIAGADNDIDKKEIKSAIELANTRQKKSKSGMMEFYKNVAEDFEDKLKILIQSYPYEATQRNPLITLDLQELNSVLPKIERGMAVEFYTTLRDIAKKMAESSGGLLGLKSIGPEEAKYILLPMIKDPASY